MVWQIGQQRQPTARRSLSCPWRGSLGWEVRGALTSVEHGAVAELRPVPAAAQQGVVGDHGGVVASSPSPAFGAPPPVRLRERRRRQGRALEMGTWGTRPRRGDCCPARWEELISPGKGGRQLRCLHRCLQRGVSQHSSSYRSLGDV